jgi:hypothetical protein
VQPCGQRFALPDRVGLLHENEKGSLKGVLNILFLVEHAATDMQDHGSMAGDFVGPYIAASNAQPPVCGCVEEESRAVPWPSLRNSHFRALILIVPGDPAITPRFLRKRLVWR